ncbi:hypothetical protein J8L88_16080 [Aquimarina sp. MMG015]|uniref:hypothetical protein n=1 Tax=Aquimarina TaxID=290174 RepID=UPI000408E69E|nr:MULTISPECIES: hypothetical protein [Aquimarina]AXT55610.1 hypothetical protein D1815_07510 [Aquimarina sp. AD1]MBQ4804384.1 hypothetical protein [Aquimarina sp. MMG015]RKN37442.1 hypothetical protein D7035_00425 [Aquimarina sp. AD1]
MKKEDVPQDESSLSKANIKEVVYAVDKDGKYGKALSSGWDAKTIALNESLELIEEQLQDTIKKIKSGELSPIAYYMELQRMDVVVLSGYVGLWQWKVKRHLKAKTFRKLNEKTLSKYAEAFEISLEELKNPKI